MKIKKKRRAGTRKGNIGRRKGRRDIKIEGNRKVDTVLVQCSGVECSAV